MGEPGRLEGRAGVEKERFTEWQREKSAQSELVTVDSNERTSGRRQGSVPSSVQWPVGACGQPLSEGLEVSKVCLVG